MLDALNQWLSTLFAVDEQTVKQLLSTALAIVVLWLGRRIVLRADGIELVEHRALFGRAAARAECTAGKSSATRISTYVCI